MFAYVIPEQKQTEKSTIQKKEPEKVVTTSNQTGIPDHMKTRFENLSGFSFNDVRVHYNSNKPAQLQALAYTQGNQVYVAPGQARHLSHELGHVVQQMRGIVAPTTQLLGVGINDDAALEREADALGRKATSYTPEQMTSDYMSFVSTTQPKKVAQGQFGAVAQRYHFWQCNAAGNVNEPGASDKTKQGNNPATIPRDLNFYWVMLGDEGTQHLYNTDAAASVAAAGVAVVNVPAALARKSKQTDGDNNGKGEYHYGADIEERYNTGTYTYGWVDGGTHVAANHTADTNARLYRVYPNMGAKAAIKPTEEISTVNHWHAGTVDDDGGNAAVGSQPGYTNIDVAHFFVKP